MSDWYMRLTLINEDGGQTAMAMYPDSLYSILETMDECQNPYGSGRYRHAAVSPNGVPADDLQTALTHVIENEKHPPSIRELNCLGGLIQQMTNQERSLLTEKMQAVPEASISNAFAAIQDIRPDLEVNHTEEYLAERAVLLEEHDPYIRIQLIRDEDDPNDEKSGIWVDCPASEEQIAETARAAGVGSLEGLQPNMMDGLFAFSDLFLVEQAGPFLSFREINQLAIAMKEHGVLSDIGKFKAILQFEDCMDFEEAAELAGKLDEYEFFRKPELEIRLQKDGYASIDDGLDGLNIEETSFGFVRYADGPDLEDRQQMI